MINKAISQGLICSICQLLWCICSYCYVNLGHSTDLGCRTSFSSVGGRPSRGDVPWLPLAFPHFQSICPQLGVSAEFVMFAMCSLLIFLLFAYFFQLQKWEFWISASQLSFLEVSHVLNIVENFEQCIEEKHKSSRNPISQGFFQIQIFVFVILYSSITFKYYTKYKYHKVVLFEITKTLETTSKSKHRTIFFLILLLF